MRPREEEEEEEEEEEGADAGTLLGCDALNPRAHGPLPRQAHIPEKVRSYIGKMLGEKTKEYGSLDGIYDALDTDRNGVLSLAELDAGMGEEPYAYLAKWGKYQEAKILGGYNTEERTAILAFMDPDGGGTITRLEWNRKLKSGVTPSRLSLPPSLPPLPHPLPLPRSLPDQQASERGLPSTHRTTVSAEPVPAYHLRKSIYLLLIHNENYYSIGSY